MIMTNAFGIKEETTVSPDYVTPKILRLNITSDAVSRIDVVQGIHILSILKPKKGHRNGFALNVGTVVSYGAMFLSTLAVKAVEETGIDHFSIPNDWTEVFNISLSLVVSEAETDPLTVWYNLPAAMRYEWKRKLDAVVGKEKARIAELTHEGVGEYVDNCGYLFQQQNNFPSYYA